MKIPVIILCLLTANALGGPVINTFNNGNGASARINGINSYNNAVSGEAARDAVNGANAAAARANEARMSLFYKNNPWLRDSAYIECQKRMSAVNAVEDRNKAELKILNEAGLKDSPRAQQVSDWIVKNDTIRYNLAETMQKIEATYKLKLFYESNPPVINPVIKTNKSK